MHDIDTKFAIISWNALDVKQVRPNWSLAKCLEGIEGIERAMKDTLTEQGFIILNDVLDS